MAIVGRTTITRNGVDVPALRRLRANMLLRNRSSKNGIVRRRRPCPGPGLLLGWLVLSLVGCGAFNPSFLALFDATGTGGFQTIDNAPGHVVLVVVNNTEVDERLLEFLLNQGLDLTDAEKQLIRPRLRLRVRVTFVDGTFQVIEFITGSRSLIDPSFDAQAFPDLNQNDMDNAVVWCDVAEVRLEPGTNLEVFVPVELTGFELVETSNIGGQIATTFEARERISPRFRAMQVDDVDDDGNTTLQRNIGIRDIPGPTSNFICGTVMGIVIEGVLSVPFLEGVTDAPSYDVNDESQEASIGGRYEFRVALQ